MTLYIPSAGELEEMCRVSEFARVIPADVSQQPKVIVKARTHTLQQIQAGCRLKFITVRVRHFLAYAVTIYDQTFPLHVWSLVQSSNEHQDLRALIGTGATFALCLFNERELNVASSTGKLTSCQSSHRNALSVERYSSTGQSVEIADEVARLFEQYDRGWFNKKQVTASDIVLQNRWIENSFSVNTPGGFLELGSASDDPGRHFEQLLSLLTAHDHSHRAYHSPVLRFTSGKRRELCDTLIVGKNLVAAIEAKALSVTHEGGIADKPRLIKRATRNLGKAVNQIIGAAKALADEGTILDSDGDEIHITHGAFIVGVVVISTLDLLEHAYEYGGPFIRDIFDKHNVVLQILDSVELRKLISFKAVLGRDEPYDWLLQALVGRWERAKQVESPRFTITIDA